MAAYTNNSKVPPNKLQKHYISNQHHGKFKHTKTPTTTTSNQQTQPKCELCNNQNPNPWHTTHNCPFKDPTFIQNTLIRENVMQHNTLYEKNQQKLHQKSIQPKSSI